MNKILILGCPGSGKSTLANRLGKKLGIPLHHLDDWQHLPLEEFKQAQSELMKADKWILDGNFTKTIEHRIPECDTLIFLDYSKSVVYWRAFVRYFKDFNDKENTIYATWGIFKYIWKFPRAEILSIIERHANGQKIIIARRPRDIEMLG